MVYNDCSGLFKQNDEVEDQVKSNKIITRPEILLHPTLPTPLDGTNPRSLMPAKEWTNVRRTAYAKNDYHCECCGKYCAYDIDNKRFFDEQLEAHEFYDIDYSSYTIKLAEVVAVCVFCHQYIHIKRSQALYDNWVKDKCHKKYLTNTEVEMWMILTHGDSVLIDADISPFIKEDDKRDYSKEWDKWKLDYKGKETYSKFNSIKEWEVKYR